MRIVRIVVDRLFDRFTHDIPLSANDERITIMIGPNGYGKTMILRIVNALFRQPVLRLARMPFSDVTIFFDDSSRLTASRRPRESTNGDLWQLEVVHHDPVGKQQSFAPEGPLNPNELGFPVGIIEDLVPGLTQVGPLLWMYLPTGETLDFDDVLNRFSSALPPIEGAAISQLPDWLTAIRKEIPIRFIDTERLTYALPPRPRPGTAYRHHRALSARTVRRHSEDLAERIQSTLTKYGTLAQSLDSSFPARLVQEPDRPQLSMGELRQELNEIEEKRSQLVDAGLLTQEPTSLAVPRLDELDDPRRGVLAVYARDARQKLSVFDDLYRRVDALKRIADSRFLHKRVTVSSDGLSVIAPDDSRLELEMLSSGEQHELVLLYELLFLMPQNSFILIDEPELSLHVAWQEQFLSDLETIAGLSDFRALLATHSPQIIGDRWDLTVQLKGPSEE